MASAARRLIALAFAAVLTGASASCRNPPEGEVSVTVIGSDPAIRDPLAGPLSESDKVLLSNVAQGLVRFDAAGNIVPGLAERWNVSDDGLSYIFRIASTEWPDGSKITAQQVARTLKRQLAPRSRNALKDTLDGYQNPVPPDVMQFQIALAAREASDGDFVPETFRHLR